MSCPEPNTCPIIDEVVDHLDKIEVVSLDVIDMLKRDSISINVSTILLIVDCVKKANLLMDDIRIANAAIRSWGEEQENAKLLNESKLNLIYKKVRS